MEEFINVTVSFSHDDLCYVATNNRLPGITAHGEEPWEALREFADALEGALHVPGFEDVLNALADLPGDIDLEEQSPTH